MNTSIMKNGSKPGDGKNTIWFPYQYIPPLLLSLLALLALASPSVLAESKTSRISQASTTTLKSNYTSAQPTPQKTFGLATPSNYVYGPSDDFQGLLPVAALPQQQVVDLISWYRSMTNVGVPVANLIATEPQINQSIDFLKTYQFQGQSINAVPAPVFASNGPSFDVNEFAQAITDKLDDEAIGYAYVINLNKQHARSDGRGAARNTTDTYASQSQYKRMNIASISKTITAVAVLQLLETNGLSVHDPVGPWLPDDWTKSYGFDNPQLISFYDLLTHQSGIKQTVQAIELFDEEFASLNKVKWNGLKAVVEYGIMPNFHHSTETVEGENQVYSNINFALFRVIIPALLEASGQPIAELGANEAAAVYQSYVAENVFLPIDIHQPSCVSATGDQEPTSYYNVFEPNGNGAETGNWSLSCGSGGWYLSAYELAKFMAYLRYSDRILSPSMRDLMDDLDLGWSYRWSLSGEHGRYQAHAGALYFDTAEWPERREQQGCIMKFPIQVEAVLLVNSSIESNTLPCTVLRDAFDAAWVH